MHPDIGQKKRLSRNIKSLLVVATLLFMGVLGISLYIYSQIEPLVSSRLKETIKLSTNGLYSISFSKLSIDPFSGNVTIRDIVFKANSGVYRTFKRQKINPHHLYHIKVKAIKLKQVHPLKVYFKSELVIKSISIENPSVRVFYEKTLAKDSSRVDSRTAWQRLSKYLRSIKIEHVQFKDIDFKYIDTRLTKPEINGIRNLSITIHDILIDSLSHLDRSRFYNSKDFRVEIHDNEFDSDDGMYTVKFDKLEMSTLSKYAMVQGLHVVPKFSEIDFSLKWPVKKARYLININEVWLNGIDYKSLIDKRHLHASSLKITTGSLDVFMNKLRPKAKGDLGENFPHKMLKQLRLVSTIDTVHVSDSRLKYSEYDPYTAKTGRITFLALNGNLLNITNDPVSLNKQHWARSSFTGYIYGKGRIDFWINFNLSSPLQEYNYSGKLHRMQAKYFNQITRPLALLDISSGMAESASFNVRADYRSAKGVLTIVYNDLNIGILKLNKNKKLQRSTILSLVANNLLLKEDNPSKGESLRKGQIKYYRPDSISFYSMIWKSLFTGIKENIGMTPERERALQDQFKSFKSDSPVRDRLQRKLEREKRKRRRHLRNKENR